MKASGARAAHLLVSEHILLNPISSLHYHYHSFVHQPHGVLSAIVAGAPAQPSALVKRPRALETLSKTLTMDLYSQEVDISAI